MNSFKTESSRDKNDNLSSWEIIIVGSGLGGLSLGVLLTKRYRKKVLIVEAQKSSEGLSGAFSRQDRFQFDIGVHYVGGLHEGSTLRALFDYLTDAKLKWEALPYEFNKLFFQDFQFSIPADEGDFRERLIARFPDETEAISKYFSDLPKFAKAYVLWQMTEIFPRLIAGLVRGALRLFYKRMFCLTKPEITRQFRDQELISILTSQWGGFGQDPSRSCFGFHCVHSEHYAKGGWYPVGGGETICQAMEAVFLQNGGRILKESKVETILVGQSGAQGVLLSSGQEFFSKVVVSNIGARRTFETLLKDDSPSMSAIKDLPAGTSGIVIYLGLRGSPKSIGLDESNYWIFDPSISGSLNFFSDLEIPYLYLTAPSFKRNDSYHTLEVVFPIPCGSFSRITAPELKLLTDSILATLETQFPGFNSLVEYIETENPVNIRSGSVKVEESIYGLPAVPERLFWPFARSQTEIENLYLTGADCFSSGVGGVIFGSAKTAELICQGKTWSNALTTVYKVMNIGQGLGSK